MLLWPLAIGIGIAMTLELKMLALSIVLGLIQIVLASHAASLQRGYVWTASSRDEAVSALTGVAGRLWGRVAYLALYAAGVFLLRSLVWNVAALGVVLVLLSLV